MAAYGDAFIGMGKEIEKLEGDRSVVLDYALYQGKTSVSTAVKKGKKLSRSLVSAKKAIRDCQRERETDAAMFEKLRFYLRAAEEEKKAVERQRDALECTMRLQNQKLEEDRDALKNERNDAVLAMGIAISSVTNQKTKLEAAIRDARGDKNELERELDQQKGALIALRKDISKLEVQRDVYMGNVIEGRKKLDASETKLHHVQHKKRKLKQEFNTLTCENALLRTAKESSQKMVEEEKEKRLCHICCVRPKDTISFPCLHLHYCFDCLEEHRRRSRTCPSCRAPISGVLRCDISIG